MLEWEVEIKFKWNDKMGNLVAFGTSLMLCNHHNYAVPKHFITPKKWVFIPNSPISSTWQSSIYFVSMDLPLLDISHQGNHTSLMCLASLTQGNIFVIHLFQHISALHSFLGLNNIQGSFFLDRSFAADFSPLRPITHSPWQQIRNLKCCHIGQGHLWNGGALCIIGCWAASLVSTH